MQTQTVLKPELLNDIPTAQNLTGFASLTVGIRTGGTSLSAPDVGGSLGEGNISLAVHGSRDTDMRMNYEGLSGDNWTTDGGGQGRYLFYNRAYVDLGRFDRRCSMLIRLSGYAACLALLGLAGVRVDAHHAFAAEFDAKSPVKLEGTVARVDWINPHMWVHVDVKNAEGKVERWMIEGGTPNALNRRGLNKNSLPIGTHVVVEGFRAWDGSNSANGQSISFPDGRKVFMGSSGTGAPYDRPQK